MKYIPLYSEMDYYRCCHSGVSQWYANIYKNMIIRRECLFEYNQNEKISKRYIAGGNSVQPKKGFYKNQPVDELDVKGMYPTIAIQHNVSFETVNCRCCENDPESKVPSEVMDEISNSLLELKQGIRTRPYWICHRIKGASPTKLQELIYERDRYQTLLKQETDPIKLVQYNARQMALKLLANAGYGVFAMETFDFSDYRVSEVITGYGRLIHKQLQKIASEKYGLETVFGFTDSIFIKNASLERINELILECRDKYHVTLEHKNRFINTIIFDKKNRFIAWTGDSANKPILKNLDGMSGRYPKWIRQNIAKIVTYIITSDNHDAIESLIDQIFHELKSGKVSHEDLAFVAKLSKKADEYKNENDRMRVLAKALGAQKGDTVYWYETLSGTGNTRKSTFSIKPENLNLEKYKNILLSKLNDILEITGLLSHTKTITITRFGGKYHD
jgi:DNA polymerase, archaea type